MTFSNRCRVATAFAALALTTSLATGASAISLEVAQKCDNAVANAFPSREPGNPAAGSAKGSGRDERAYYKKCVANGGKVTETPQKASPK